MKNNVAQRRNMRGLTLVELAKYSRISASQLSKLERGESTPTLLTAYKLSYILNCDVYDLFPPDFKRPQAVVDTTTQKQERMYRVLVLKQRDGLYNDVELILQRKTKKGEWVDIQSTHVGRDEKMDYTFGLLLVQAINGAEC